VGASAFFALAGKKQKRGAKAQRKTSAKKANAPSSKEKSAKRKKRKFALFPPFAAPQWKPGS
jgi:hypothetical protein